MFSGVVGAPDDAAFPTPPYTTLDTTAVSREKPFLFVDSRGEYQVRVPAARRDTRGITWADGLTPGRTVPLTDFFVARPSDPWHVINAQLARHGKCFVERQDADLFVVRSDDANFPGTNFTIDPEERGRR